MSGCLDGGVGDVGNARDNLPLDHVKQGPTVNIRLGFCMAVDKAADGGVREGGDGSAAAAS